MKTAHVRVLAGCCEEEDELDTKVILLPMNASLVRFRNDVKEGRADGGSGSGSAIDRLD